MRGQKGFTAPIVLVLVLIALAGTAYVVKTHLKPSQPAPVATSSPSAELTASDSATPVATPSPTPSPSKTASSSVASVPMVDCVGPDGKHVQMTQTDCTSFNKAWAKPTPTPSISSSSSSSGSSSSASSDSGPCAGSGTLTISLNPDSGPVVGDALINVSVLSSGCNASFHSQDILKQGNSSLSYSNLVPASYNVYVTYHGKQVNDSADVSAGSTTSKVVNVSN